MAQVMQDFVQSGYGERAGLNGNGNGYNAFGYTPASFSDHTPFDNGLKAPSLLDAQDIQDVNGFFDDPDGSVANMRLQSQNTFNFGMNGKAEPNGMGSSYTFLQATGAATVDPASTMASMSQGNYQTPSANEPMRARSHHGSFLAPGNHHVTEDSDGAYTLMDIHRGQENPNAQHSHSLDNPSAAASWGAMGLLANASIATGADLSGMARHSSDHSDLGFGVQSGLFAQQQQFHGMQPRVGTGRQVQRGLPHGLNYYHHMMLATASPADHAVSRVPFARFNSDPNISGSPYAYNAATFGNMQEGKEVNLMQVPFAGEAASGGRMHSHGRHMSQQDQRTHHVNRMPNGSRTFNSTQSSPVDGLPPTPSMLTPTHQQPAQWGGLRMPGRNPVREGTDEDVYIESQPRKRRKSQMEHEDDAEYQPAPQMQGDLPKRGPKVPKAEVASEDEDFEPFTPTNRSSAKRRRSTHGRTASGSSPNSPADAASPTNGGFSTDRRKSKARQNLSDEQKRQNHIISEQKRRNVIKQGYHDLDNLVPILNGGKSGLSRADQVKEIVAYLVSIVEGNRVVEARLQRDEDDDDYDDDAAGVAGLAAY